MYPGIEQVRTICAPGGATFRLYEGPMIRTLHLLALPLLLSAAACVRTEAARLGPALHRAPVHVDSVQVYRSERDIQGSFQKVAVVYVEGDVSPHHRSRMIRAARKKAGRLGANAIILREFRDPSTARVVASILLKTNIPERLEVVAVRIDAESSDQSFTEPREIGR